MCMSIPGNDPGMDMHIDDYVGWTIISCKENELTSTSGSQHCPTWFSLQPGGLIPDGVWQDA
jgi:hypothetical protein